MKIYYSKGWRLEMQENVKDALKDISEMSQGDFQKAMKRNKDNFYNLIRSRIFIETNP